MARLFGLSPASPSSASVLELGCGDGTNLIGMAFSNPTARFVGIDASDVHIRTGREALREVGLDNLELIQADISTVDFGKRRFDYIIVHGVYSWVKEPVRKRIMSIARDFLSDQGVVFISYNVLPGFASLESVRAIARFFTAPSRSLSDRVARARLAFTQIGKTLMGQAGPYAQILRDRIDFIATMPDSYVAHEVLAEESTPFYFADFIKTAGAFGLQYLGEPTVAEMLPGTVPQSSIDTLSRINDQVAQEQVLDFVKGRAFRQTLLCHSGRRLVRTISSNLMGTFAFRALYTPENQGINTSSGIIGRFRSLSGLGFETSSAFATAAFLRLSQESTRFVDFPEIVEFGRAAIFSGERRSLSENAEMGGMQKHLLRLLMQGMVEISTVPTAKTSDSKRGPRVSALARFQAARSNRVTNRLHHSVELDTIARRVVVLCDGTRTWEEILESLTDTAAATQTLAEPCGRGELRTALRPQLDRVMQGLTASAMFD